MIATNTFPNISQHKLFLLLGNWTNETHFQEKLRHLCAPNFDIWLISISIFRNLNNIKFKTSFLEVSIEPIMNHFIWEWIDLNLWHHRFLPQGSFLSLLLLLSTVCVFKNSIKISLHIFGFAANLWIEFKVLVLLSQVVFSSDLLFEDWMLINSHWITKVTLSSLSLNLNDSLRSRIDSWMMGL